MHTPESNPYAPPQSGDAAQWNWPRIIIGCVLVALIAACLVVLRIDGEWLEAWLLGRPANVLLLKMGLACLTVGCLVGLVFLFIHSLGQRTEASEEHEAAEDEGEEF
jgi:hypothetical protein